MLANYSVNLWGSHPDSNNDDCCTGWDFETLTEARERFEVERNGYDLPFVELTGPGVYEVARTKNVVDARRDDRSDWNREIAMEAGMLHGIDAYNDIQGY